MKEQTVSFKAKGSNCIYKGLVDRPFCLEAEIIGYQFTLQGFTEKEITWNRHDFVMKHVPGAGFIHIDFTLCTIF